MDIDVEAMLDAPYQEKRVMYFKTFIGFFSHFEKIYKLIKILTILSLTGRTTQRRWSTVIDFIRSIHNVLTVFYINIVVPDTTLHTLNIALILVTVLLTPDHILDIAAGDIAVLLDQSVEKEDIDVLLLVNIKEVVEVEDAVVEAHL